MFHAGDVEARTGWKVLWRRVVGSTNDEVIALRDGGVTERVAVVADRQTAGRGRAGRRFASPVGGLYASVLLQVRAEDAPAPLVAAIALALSEAIESATGAEVQVKWPNDLWVEGKKVAGILTEAAAGSTSPHATVAIVAGIGVNVQGVPSDLPDDVALATTALDLHSRAPVRREDLLSEFLIRLDREVSALVGGGALGALEAADALTALENRYRGRVALRGSPIRYRVGDVEESGILKDVSLALGLLVEREDGSRAWRPMAQVSEVRPVFDSERGRGGAPRA